MMVLARVSSSKCPRSGLANGPPGTSGYTAQVDSAALDGVTMLCGVAQIFGPPAPLVKSYPLLPVAEFAAARLRHGIPRRTE